MDHPHGRSQHPHVLTRRPALFGGLLALVGLLLGVAGIGALLANPIVTVQLQAPGITEGNAGTSTATFTVSLSQALGAGQQIVLAVQTLPGPSNQATAGASCGGGVDYLSNSATLTFNPGDISQTFPVTICGDTTDELNESFVVRVTVQSQTGVPTVQPPVGQFTELTAIIPDDDNPTVQSISDPTAVEGNTLDFVVTLSAAPIENVVIAYSTGAGGDTADSTATCPALPGNIAQDYIGVTSGTLTIPAGQQTGTISITVCDDALAEGAETMTLTLDPSNSFSVNTPFEDTTATGTIQDANVAPTIPPGQTFSVNENSPNGTNVGTVTATDPEVPPQTLSYSITAGNTGGAFAINATSGQITVLGALDFENLNTYTLTVQVCDDGAPIRCATGTVTVNVTDVNDAPVVTGATFSIAENSATGTNVGTPVVATDPEVPPQTLSYSITAGNIGSAFAINATSGQITVANPLDFETTPTYTLTVQVCDNAAPSACGQATVTVNVTNVNDVAPTITTPSFSVAENSPNGTVVGTIGVADADGPGTSFTVNGGTGQALFNVNASSGQITVAGALDFESQSSYTLIVDVCDGGSPNLCSENTTVTVNVTDVNEAPKVDLNGAAPGINYTGTYTENDPPTLIVAGDAFVNDPDAGAQIQTITAVITDPLNGAAESLSATPGGGITVSYDPATYTLTITGPASPAAMSAVLQTLSYANTSDTPGISRTITVVATDIGNLSSPVAASVIAITEVDDPPTLLNTGLTVGEGQSAVIAAANLQAQDPDTAPANLVFTLASVPTNGQLRLSGVPLVVGDQFNQIDINGGSLSYTHNDTETSSDSFTFTVSDGTTTLPVATFTITITPANDNPVLTLTPGVVAYSQGQPPVALDPNATLTDPDTPVFNGGTLTVSLTGGASDDQLGIQNQGNGPGQVGRAGAQVRYGGVVIGSVSGGSGTPLVVTFNTNATLTAVEAVVRAVTFANVAPGVTTGGQRTATFIVSDGAGGNSAPVTKLINFNRMPTVANDAFQVIINTPRRLPVLANDSEPDGDPMTITAVSSPTNGTVQIIENGAAVRYTPNPNYTGADSFSYTVSDGQGATATATVSLTVERAMILLPVVNDRPVEPDLVVSFEVVPPNPRAFGPAAINVTVTNRGRGSASNFWVDFYINPREAPTVNQPWNELCRDRNCRGIAWFYAGTLRPGESVTFTSTPQSADNPNGYQSRYTIWDGFFENGSYSLYAYVDSWNRDSSGAARDPRGAIAEENEDNNRAERQVTVEIDR